MAEQGELILNNWTLGMSPEKYSGGSYLYAENINSSNNSKSFRLSYGLTYDPINNRPNGDIIFFDEGIMGTMCITKDGYIETPNKNGIVNGALYKRNTGSYITGKIIGNNTLAITSDKIDRFIGTSIYGDNLVVNPTLNTGTGWTGSTGWTFGAGGATHTSGGGTTPLSQIIETGEGKGRLVFKITGFTTGNVQIGLGEITSGIFTASTSKDVVIVYTGATSASDQIEIQPSNTFNGTISFIGAYKYNTNFKEDEFTITPSAQHPLLLDGAMLYIGCGSVINAINTSTWTVEPEISIFNTNDTIVGITRVGANIVVFTNDGINSKQIYCDGTLSSIQETIERNNTTIEQVTQQGPIIYVLTDSYFYKTVYQVSGWNRNKISGGEEYYSSSTDIKSAYKLKDRFKYYDSTYKNRFKYINNKLYIPTYTGMYSYGNELVGQPNSLQVPYMWNYSQPTSINVLKGRLVFGLKGYHESTGAFLQNSLQYERKDLDLQDKYGYLYTNPILWDNLGSKKDIRKLELGYISPTQNSKIDIWVGVNYKYYWTFYVSGVTTTPSIGSIYSKGSLGNMTVLSTDITNGVGTISCYCDILNYSEHIQASGTLTKVSGTGDTSIDFSDHENFIKIKTITSDRFKIGSELIFKDTFLEKNFPDWYNIQFKIGLYTGTESPEIFDIRLSSDIISNND